MKNVEEKFFRRNTEFFSFLAELVELMRFKREFEGLDRMGRNECSRRKGRVDNVFLELSNLKTQLLLSSRRKFFCAISCFFSSKFNS